MGIASPSALHAAPSFTNTGLPASWFCRRLCPTIVPSHPIPTLTSQEMCRKIGVKKKLRVQKLQQEPKLSEYQEKLQEFSLGILSFLTNQEEARQ